MNFYEELGLSKTASLDEIRQAYKHLARLMHPDQQPDGDVRQLAELQMKRLNMILAVLGNPSQRRHYDMTLVPARPRRRNLLGSAAPNATSTVSRTGWIWLGAVFIGVASIAVYFGQYGGHEPRFRTEPPRIEPTAPPPPGLAFAVLGRSPMRGERLSAQPAAQPRPEFGGAWFYARPGNLVGGPGLYPPDYIELSILQQAGRIQGIYRARYLVPDHPVSPAVTFQFAGPVSAPVSTLPWNAGNAAGQVTLKLISVDSLEVSWSAVKSSEQLALTSGIATLVRGRHP